MRRSIEKREPKIEKAKEEDYASTVEELRKKYIAIA